MQNDLYGNNYYEQPTDTCEPLTSNYQSTTDYQPTPNYQPPTTNYQPSFDDITPTTPLDTLDGEEICELRFKREKYLVESLIKPGLTVLAGSPKIGKSWLVLQICLSVAKGEPFWGLKTMRSDVLYLALEDSEQRLQRRMLTLTSEPTPRLHFALSCSPLGCELEKELAYFIAKHPLTRLIVIDTLQKIRADNSQPNYADDYRDISRLKSIADGLGICILLVHHTRKLGDSDRFNEISGTNGIAGSADTLMVLTKEKRTERKATLSVTGRDVEDMELKPVMDKRSCRWRCDTPVTAAELTRELPEELKKLTDYMMSVKKYEGPNKGFAEGFSAYTGEPVNIRKLKQKMAYFRYELEDMGVSYVVTRDRADRGILIMYSERADKRLNGQSCTDA